MHDAAEEAIRRGQRAQEMLADPLMREAFDGLRETLTYGWANSPARDADGREIIYAQIKALESVELAFKAWIAGGKIAADRVRLSNAERSVNGTA